MKKASKNNKIFLIKIASKTKKIFSSETFKKQQKIFSSKIFKKQQKIVSLKTFKKQQNFLIKNFQKTTLIRNKHRLNQITTYIVIIDKNRNYEFFIFSKNSKCRIDTTLIKKFNQGTTDIFSKQCSHHSKSYSISLQYWPLCKWQRTIWRTGFCGAIAANELGLIAQQLVPKICKKFKAIVVIFSTKTVNYWNLFLKK